MLIKCKQWVINGVTQQCVLSLFSTLFLLGLSPGMNAATTPLKNSVRIWESSPSHVTFDSSDYHVTGKAPDLHTQLVVDMANVQGGLFTPSGAMAGEYRFYDILEDRVCRARLLHLMTPAQFEAGTLTNAYFYLSQNGTNDFILIGVSDALALEPVKLNTPYLGTLTRLFYAPEKLQGHETDSLTLYDYWSPPLKGILFQRSFIPILARQFISLLSQHRINLKTLNIPNEYFFVRQVLMQFVDYTDNVVELPSQEREQIFRHLKSCWSTLSFEEKAFFLPLFEKVDQRTANIVSALIIDFLDQQKRQVVAGPNTPQTFEFIINFTENFSLNSTLRDHVRRCLVQTINAMPPWMYLLPPDEDRLFLSQILDPENVFYNPIKNADLRILMDALAKHVYLPVPTASYLFSRAYTFLTDGQRESLHAFIQRYTSSLLEMTDENQDLLSIAMALPFLEGPVRSDEINQFAEIIDKIYFNGHPGIIQAEFCSRLTWASLDKLPPDLKDRVLSAITDSFLNLIASRNIADAYNANYEGVLMSLIQLVKSAPSFEDSYERMLPFLMLLNPQQPLEEDSAFAARSSRIRKLWTEKKTVLVDYSGGTVRHPDYIDVIANYVENHPGWTDMVVLSTQETAEGKPGAVQINWNIYDTAHKLAYVLLHEGGHSLQLRCKAKDRLLEHIPNFWHAESLSSNSLSVVSRNAVINSLEYWAEHTRFFHADQRLWLKTSLDRFQKGDNALLNMFLFIWNQPGPVDQASEFVRPLFKLNSNGLLEREFLPARWKEGNMKGGIFEFQFEGATYVTVYRDYMIQELQQDGHSLKISNQKPALTYGAVFNAAVGYTNFFAPSLFSDAESSRESLHFELLIGPPGAQIDSETGVVTWRPDIGQQGTNVLIISLTDDGQPAMQDIAILDAIASEGPPLPILKPVRLNLQLMGNSGITLTIAGAMARSYSVQVSPNLVDWTELTKGVAQQDSFEYFDATDWRMAHKFYRVLLH